MHWNDFHNLHLRVEFTNSYHDHMNSTSHFRAHFSGSILIVYINRIFFYTFQQKKVPPRGIYSCKVELTFSSHPKKLYRAARLTLATFQPPDDLFINQTVFLATPLSIAAFLVASATASFTRLSNAAGRI